VRQALPKGVTCSTIGAGLGRPPLASADGFAARQFTLLRPVIYLYFQVASPNCHHSATNAPAVPSTSHAPAFPLYFCCFYSEARPVLMIRRMHRSQNPLSLFFPLYLREGRAVHPRRSATKRAAVSSTSVAALSEASAASAAVTRPLRRLRADSAETPR
jgi:hypothetical protein